LNYVIQVIVITLLPISDVCNPLLDLSCAELSGAESCFRPDRINLLHMCFLCDGWVSCFTLSCYLSIYWCMSGFVVLCLFSSVPC